MTRMMRSGKFPYLGTGRGDDGDDDDDEGDDGDQA